MFDKVAVLELIRNFKDKNGVCPKISNWINLRDVELDVCLKSTVQSGTNIMVTTQEKSDVWQLICSIFGGNNNNTNKKNRLESRLQTRSSNETLAIDSDVKQKGDRCNYSDAMSKIETLRLGGWIKYMEIDPMEVFNTLNNVKFDRKKLRYLSIGDGRIWHTEGSNYFSSFEKLLEAMNCIDRLIKKVGIKVLLQLHAQDISRVKEMGDLSKFRKKSIQFVVFIEKNVDSWMKKSGSASQNFQLQPKQELLNKMIKILTKWSKLKMMNARIKFQVIGDEIGRNQQFEFEYPYRIVKSLNCSAKVFKDANFYPPLYGCKLNRRTLTSQLNGQSKALHINDNLSIVVSICDFNDHSRFTRVGARVWYRRKTSYQMEIEISNNN